jgi:hypothetical protein
MILQVKARTRELPILICERAKRFLQMICANVPDFYTDTQIHRRELGFAANEAQRLRMMFNV